MRDADAAKSRMWSWVNPSKKHYSSGAPVGYKIMCKDLVPLLVKDDSLVARRAPFAKHHIWTVPYTDNSLYPAGKFPTQTKQAPEDSLEGWVARNDSISDVDREPALFSLMRRGVWEVVALTLAPPSLLPFPLLRILRCLRSRLVHLVGYQPHRATRRCALLRFRSSGLDC